MSVLLVKSVVGYETVYSDRYKYEVRLTDSNLGGFGDRFSMSYLNTDGSDSLNDLNYTIPVNAYNGTLSFRFSYTDSEIIEEPFDRFDIASENTNYEFTYRIITDNRILRNLPPATLHDGQQYLIEK